MDINAEKKIDEVISIKTMKKKLKGRLPRTAKALSNKVWLRLQIESYVVFYALIYIEDYNIKATVYFSANNSLCEYHISVVAYSGYIIWITKDPVI